MPWKERSVVDGRLRFVARLLEGEPMSHVCREFGENRIQDLRGLQGAWARAPRSMKMGTGTTLSLSHYDEASRHALQSANLRRPTILRYAL